MSDLLSQLQHWSLLEPDRCRPFASTGFHTREPVQGDRRWWLVRVEGDAHSLSRLQASVQGAIAARGLRYTLEGTLDTHYAKVFEPEIRRYALGKDTEPSVALLKAYARWLETNQREVLAQQGDTP